KILESLRPAPPAQNPLPFQLAAGIGLLLLAAWGFRRAQGGQKFAWWYMAPSAVAMIVLVFVPFSVGGGMSLFHYGDGKWTFIGFRNFIDILSCGFAPLSFWFTLAVTALWTVANVTLHVAI